MAGRHLGRDVGGRSGNAASGPAVAVCHSARLYHFLGRLDAEDLSDDRFRPRSTMEPLSFFPLLLLCWCLHTPIRREKKYIVIQRDRERAKAFENTETNRADRQKLSLWIPLFYLPDCLLRCILENKLPLHFQTRTLIGF